MSMKMLDEEIHLEEEEEEEAGIPSTTAASAASGGSISSGSSSGGTDDTSKRRDSRTRLLRQQQRPSNASKSKTKKGGDATASGGRRKTLDLPRALMEDERLFAGATQPLSLSSSCLSEVNSTTCLMRHSLGDDDDDDNTTDKSLRSSRRRDRRASSSSSTKASTSGLAPPLSMGTERKSYTSPRRVSAVGKFRYLKPEEIQKGHLPQYDFALIVNRSVEMPSKVSQFFSNCCCCICSGNGDEEKADRMGFRRLCLVNSPLLRESEDEHRRIVDKLCGQGLMVDIIDGGHSKGEMNSGYFILLVRASDEVVNAYVKRFRFHLWMEHGAVGDMELDLCTHRNSPPTPAERVQIVDYIIEQRANLTPMDLWIHDMFPMHNKSVSDKLIAKWVASWRVFDVLDNDQKILKSLRYNFGEKVAYYFAFLNYYNRWLLPIALIGIVVQLLHGVLPTITYMRLLPFWGIGVSVIWSFLFLKSWQRRNASMQYEWNQKLHVKQIEYPNKFFYGEKKVNSLTGDMETVYPSWRRLPKYFCVLIFMLFQMVIMLILVAIWVTIYELLKAKYPESHIFSTQWFLILLEGIVFGIFVDVIQWNMVVTKMGRLFTHWENYRTEEQYEKALVRKLFLLDFLNYYTWFFSLAFVFVIPGFGDYLTNTLNHTLFGDAMNCCFGPYVDQHGQCIMCPVGPKDATCIECVGYFTFDRHHVDLSAMFVTPIVVTQSLNILLELVAPILVRMRRERAQAYADAQAQKRVMEAGSMKILGSLDYENKGSSHFSNKASARYLEYTPAEIEVLNKKAREILFDSEQDTYDPYNDFHALTVQFGFTVMFSILWPLMPFACLMINGIKRRADGFRLCKTLKRPIPRRANGIGAWKGVFTTYAYIAVIVNVLLICISTGALEFFDETCIRDIEHQLEKQGKTLADFILGPDFGCLHISWRLLIILLLEHLLIGMAYLLMMRVPNVPDWIKVVMNARENQFKEILRSHEAELFPLTSGNNAALGRSGSGGDDDDNASKEKGMLLSESRIDIGDFLPTTRRSVSQREELIPRQLSIDPITPLGSNTMDELELASSNGIRSKAREQLARKWSAESDQM